MRLRASLILLSAASSLAADPFLDLPVDCTLGQTCFIEDYVDHDPGPGSADYTCGLNTRDGHRGTDIALPGFDALSGTGVAVLAAADGRVLRVRDGMPDTGRTEPVASDVACGNAVIVEHSGGWLTQYCHLRRGSLKVSPGDAVSSGDPIGLVGLSGQTTHPHLHLSVYRDGRLVDPFAPDPSGQCGTADITLWRDPPAYDATLLRLAGFAHAVPDYDALRSGSARIDEAPPDAPLVIYAEAGHARDGDVLVIRAEGPDGREVFRHSRIMTDPKVSQLPAFGKRAPEGGWPTGDYLGQITITRSGRLVANRFAHVTVVP